MFPFFYVLHVASLHFNVVRRFVVRLQVVKKTTESLLEFVCSPLASSVYIGFSSVFLNQRTSLTLSSASVARLQGSEAGPPAITATWATEAGTRRYRHVYTLELETEAHTKVRNLREGPF